MQTATCAMRRLTAGSLALAALVSAPAFADVAYDQLILRAREGDTGPALAVLRQKGANASLNERFDHILIASWAGDPAEVMAVSNNLPLTAQAPPANVQLAIARALRDQKRWPEALAAYRAGLQQYPNEVTFAAGFIMTLADAGQRQEAIMTGQDWTQRFPNNVDLRMAVAYVHSADATQQHPYEALFHTDKATQLAPDAPWVQREYPLALQRAKMPRQALEYARAHPGVLTPAQLRALDADAAAIQTRMAAMATRSERERFVIADRTLARYEELIRTWNALGTEAANDVVRIRIDRLAALHARVYMQEVVREYETLIREGVRIPAWALSNVASAYLYLRHPETARDLFRAVLADLEATTPPTARDNLGPGAIRLNNSIGLFYALTETRQFDQLPPVLENIRRYKPSWLYFKGNPIPEPNPLYLDAQQLWQVEVPLALDDTPTAQARAEALVTAAPNNTSLRANLAEVYLARAQPRRAEVEFKLAETMAPRSLAVENGQGAVALALQEWQQAELLSADTIARYPENKVSQRLAQQVKVHNMAEVRISGSRGLASDSPVAGHGGTSVDTAIYSSPVAYNLRLFAGLGHTQSTFPEGKGHATWQRAGVEWRARDVWAEVELSANSYGLGNKIGGRLSLAYDVNDHWHFGGDIEQASRRTPLRALRSGVSADAAGAYVRWRAHERREWYLSALHMGFDDQNRRWEAELSGNERVYTSPNLRMNLMLSLAAQHNSQDDDRLYYNPKRGLMLLQGISMNHTLNQRYENAWEQFASVSVGAFQQRAYGTDSVYALAYGQRYRYRDLFEAELTLNSISRPWDGDRERETQISFDLISRF